MEFEDVRIKLFSSQIVAVKIDEPIKFDRTDGEKHVNRYL